MKDDQEYILMELNETLGTFLEIVRPRNAFATIVLSKNKSAKG